MPFKISETLDQLAPKLKFIKSVNDVDMYHLIEEDNVELFNYRVLKTTLYFANNELIAVYYLLNKKAKSITGIIKSIINNCEYVLKQSKETEFEITFINTTEKLHIGLNKNLIFIYQSNL